MRVDPEKGKDKHVTEFYGPEDLDVSIFTTLHFSSLTLFLEFPKRSVAKKFFVTFEVCFLTFSIYIGSAIYTAGVMDVERTFHVSQVAATLGLTL